MLSFIKNNYGPLSTLKWETVTWGVTHFEEMEQSGWTKSSLRCHSFFPLNATDRFLMKLLGIMWLVAPFYHCQSDLTLQLGRLSDLIFTKSKGPMTCLVRKEFSCNHWNRGITSSFGMNLLLRIPRYVTKLEGGHWLVGPSFKLLMQSMTAVMTPDHLTLHFPSGSGIPAVTLGCQVMSSVEWQWNFSRTCVPQWGVMACFWL